MKINVQNRIFVRMMLHFLDERGVLSALLARRPDLGEIELSCQNTDTTLPVVDRLMAFARWWAMCRGVGAGIRGGLRG